MSHVTAAEQVAYVEGNLAPERLPAVEAHLNGCAECANAVANMRARCDEEDGRIAWEWSLERPTCPPQEDLKAFAAERLTGAPRERVRLHLDVARCPSCRAILEALNTPTDQARELMTRARTQIQKKISTRR